MRLIKLAFAASLAVVLLGNIAPPQSGSVISTQATAQPGVHVSPLATPEPRDDSDRQERREARRELRRMKAAQSSALNWAEPRK